MTLSLQEPNTGQVIHLLLIPIIWLILLPILIKWLYEIGKKKKTVIMQKRYIGLSLFSCILCIIWITIGLPMYIIQGNLTIFSSSTSSFINVGFGVAISIFYPILNFGLHYSLLIRYFMLYFYSNWTDITLTNWIIHIRKPSKSKQKETDKNNHNNTDGQNNNINGQKQQWFIKNRTKYGNVHRVLRKLYLFYIVAICSVIFVSVMAVYPSPSISSSTSTSTSSSSSIFSSPLLWPIIEVIVDWIFFIVQSVAIICLWQQTPKNVHDSFFFRTELKQLTYIIIVTLIIHTLLAMLKIYIQCTNNRDSLQIYLRICDEIYVIFTCLMTIYFQTQWIINRINNEADVLECDVNIFYNNAPNYDPSMTKINLLSSSSANTLSLNSSISSNTNNTLPNKQTAMTLAAYSHSNTIQMPRIDENIVHQNNQKQKLSINSNLSNDVSQHSDQEMGDTKQPEIAVTAEKDEYDKQIYRILFVTLQQDKLFNNLTCHLASEYSMECSFAFIEFTQFKRLLERDMSFMQNVSIRDPIYNSKQMQSSISQCYSYQLVKLPSSISRSTIVHNKKYSRMQGNDRYRKIAKKLTEKYLENGSEFELSINHETKHEVINWVKSHCRHFKPISSAKTLTLNNDFSTNISSNISSNGSTQSAEYSSGRYSSKPSLYDDLYHLFEQCRKEIYDLMAHSCDRYVKIAEKMKRNHEES